MKKTHKTLITLTAIIAYIWSVSADALPVGGAIVVLLYALWFLVPTKVDPKADPEESWILKKINEAAGVTTGQSVEKDTPA